VQDSLDELSHACERYFGLLPPFFEQTNYTDVRSSFLAIPIAMVPQQFDQLVTHRNADTLHNIKIQDCRDPTNFGTLEDFRKQLSGFLVNLSRHRDDPVISVRKKLENRADAASNCVDRVKAILNVSEPNLIMN